MVRNSEQTKRRILAAVGRLLVEKGMAGVGINAIAQEAGVDKVLIYRYFEGLPQLLRVFAKQNSFWPDLSQLLEGEEMCGDIEGIGFRLLAGHLHELRKRPDTQEILRWELLQKNELTDELARVREEQGSELFAKVMEGRTPPEADLPAAVSILHAGLTYLILRSKTAQVYMGIDLHSEEGWERIERAIGALLEPYCRSFEGKK